MDIIVGIDVSKHRLDIAIASSGTAFFVDNNQAGIDVLPSPADKGGVLWLSTTRCRRAPSRGCKPSTPASHSSTIPAAAFVQG